MKMSIPQKEILLLTGTSFTNREWCSAIVQPSDYYTKQRQMEEASWNGLLHELLPEILGDNYTEEKLYLWFVRHGHAFIQLELCQEPLIIDREYSIDPYLFLSAHINN